MKLRIRPALAVAGLALACALGSACELEDVATTPTPAATPTITPTVAPTPTPTPDLGPLASLDEALAFDELLARVPLEPGRLLYAVKSGFHVTVYLRDTATGEQEVLLEYDEPREAKHSGNSWQELPPSIDFSRADSRLIYSTQIGLVARDVAGGPETVLFETAEAPEPVAPQKWVSASGAELCCGYHLSTPHASGDGTFVSVLLSLSEGSRQGIVRADGTLACALDYQVAALYPEWAPDGRSLLIPSSGGYFPTGLVLVSLEDGCPTTDIDDRRDLIYYSADWSPDGGRMIVSVGYLSESATSTDLIFLSPDGSARATLLNEGQNLWPRFSPEGDSVYYVYSEGRGDLGNPLGQSVRRYDLDSGETSIIAGVPESWRARTLGWTEDGYLQLLLYSADCHFYLSCRNRLAVLDVTSGGVVYLSPEADFTTFLGFLP